MKDLLGLTKKEIQKLIDTNILKDWDDERIHHFDKENSLYAVSFDNSEESDYAYHLIFDSTENITRPNRFGVGKAHLPWGDRQDTIRTILAPPELLKLEENKHTKRKKENPVVVCMSTTSVILYTGNLEFTSKYINIMNTLMEVKKEIITYDLTLSIKECKIK